MRRFLFFALFITCFDTANSAIKIWDGGGDAISWNDPLNWNLDALPLSTDDVILDNSIVVASYSVILPSGAVTIALNSLTINPTGLNNIILTLPITNINNPGLNITGTGDVLVLNNGAILKNSSGINSGASIAVTGTFRINNGGHYIHNAKGTNAALINRLSSVAGTELGEFEFDDPDGGTAISLNNRTFGSLTLSAITNGLATYIGNGTNPLTINGNLTINTTTTLSIDFSANVIIKGNLNQIATSSFNISNGGSNTQVRIEGNINVAGTILETGSAFPLLVLIGTINQNVSIANMTDNVTLSINNAAGATLTAPLTLPYNLQFTTGKITTDATNILKMMPNSSYVGASSTSFVEGPMKKVGVNNFIFPIGVGSIFAPIGIIGSGGALITDEFTAEYKRANPQGVHGSVVQSGINHVSYVEYWTLIQNVGAASKQISLKVNTTSFCLVLGNTFVSRWDGGQWTNEGATITGFTSIPPFETGTITSTSTMSSFGDFTLSTDLSFAANPLPIKLISFNAIKSNANAALLKWELAACCSDAAKFEVEKSTDNRTFVAFDKVPGSLTNRFYTLPDNRLSKGITYYRLKMIDEDGTITYSKTVALINDETGLLITSLYPNPVQSNTMIAVSVAKPHKLNFSICDLSGKIVKQWNASMTEGNNNIPVNTDGLASGIYHVIAASDNNKIVFRFIKQ